MELKLRRLQRLVELDVLGVPNLTLYHYAFCLRHIIQWALPPERTPRGMILRVSCAVHALNFLNYFGAPGCVGAFCCWEICIKR